MSHYGEGVRRANAVEAADKQFKPCGYGLVDRCGIVLPGMFFKKKELAELYAKTLNRSDAERLCRVVELFYKEEELPVGPIPSLDEMRELLNGGCEYRKKD